MSEAKNQILVPTAGQGLKRQIRLLDGRLVKFSIDKPFSITSDSSAHRWDFSWLNPNHAWGSLMLENLIQLLCTHSLSHAYNSSYTAKALFSNSIFQSGNPIRLDAVARAPELIPMSYWPVLQPLLKRMSAQDSDGALSNDLKSFLKQPNKWETKGKGAYFALVTNDPVNGAFTEQELFSIQEGVNSSYEKYRISLAEYALVWFLIGTGVRPVQIARMKTGDVKVYAGPEGKEVTLYIPLAKGEASSDQGKWRRRCPTILAEI